MYDLIFLKDTLVFLKDKDMVQNITKVVFRRLYVYFMPVLPSKLSLPGVVDCVSDSASATWCQKDCYNSGLRGKFKASQPEHHN